MHGSGGGKAETGLGGARVAADGEDAEDEAHLALHAPGGDGLIQGRNQLAAVWAAGAGVDHYRDRRIGRAYRRRTIQVHLRQGAAAHHAARPLLEGQPDSRLVLAGRTRVLAEVVSGRAAIAAFWKVPIEAGLKDIVLETQEVESAGDLAYEVGTVKLVAPWARDAD